MFLYTPESWLESSPPELAFSSITTDPVTERMLSSEDKVLPTPLCLLKVRLFDLAENEYHTSVSFWKTILQMNRTNKELL